MDKITKLPWIAVENEVKNCDGYGVAECSNEERASQIVLAVNSHEGLVKLLKKSAELFVKLNIPNVPESIVGQICEALKAADGEGV